MTGPEIIQGIAEQAWIDAFEHWNQLGSGKELWEQAQVRVAEAYAPLARLVDTAREGHDMIESMVAHVSHGGPTREQAEMWLAKMNAALRECEAAARGRE